MATCCPRESQQIPQVNFSPERRSQQGEEPGERVIPAAHHAQKAHQDVEQERRADLPADRVGAVAQEIAQLQALLDLFKEHFDLPAATIQISHTAGASPKRGNRLRSRTDGECGGTSIMCRRTFKG